MRPRTYDLVPMWVPVTVGAILGVVNFAAGFTVGSTIATSAIGATLIVVVNLLWNWRRRAS